MRRKVNRVGQSTLTVSLPASWVKTHGIEKGHEVDISQDGPLLVLAPRGQEREKETHITVKQPHRFIARQLFNLYRKGATRIRVTYDSSVTLSDIRECLGIMVGFEIQEQKKGEVVLASMMSVDEMQFDQALRRIFLLNKSLADESYETIRKGELSELTGIAEYEEMQNAQYLYCSRVVNMRPQRFSSPTLMYLLLQRLEDIGDDYRRLCELISEKRQARLSKPTMELYRHANTMVAMLHDMYYQYTPDKGEFLIKAKKKGIAQGLALLEDGKKSEQRIIFLLSNIIVKTYDASSPIFGLKL